MFGYFMLFFYGFILIILPLIGLLWWFLYERYEKKTKELKDLSYYLSEEFRNYWNRHEDYSEAKALRKFFKFNDIRYKALRKKREAELIGRQIMCEKGFDKKYSFCLKE